MCRSYTNTHRAKTPSTAGVPPSLHLSTSPSSLLLLLGLFQSLLQSRTHNITASTLCCSISALSKSVICVSLCVISTRLLDETWDVEIRPQLPQQTTASAKQVRATLSNRVRTKRLATTVNYVVKSVSDAKNQLCCLSVAVLLI